MHDEQVKIQSREFSLFYGGHEAVKKVTMDVPAKRVTAIIGPSGCGKSSFLRSINRMNDLIPGVHTEGSLCVDGHDVNGRNVDVVVLRRRVGMVFQRSNPFPKTVFDNIAYGPRLVGLRNRQKLTEIVEKSLQMAALWEEVKDRLHHHALDLSGGQQQRLCIARALAVDPVDIPFDFLGMAEKVQAMLRKSLDSLVNMDADLAYRVCAADDEVDTMNREMYHQVAEEMRKSPDHIDCLIHLLGISRDLERIADYATNIAEDVIYMIQGDIVRHQAEKYAVKRKANSRS